MKKSKKDYGVILPLEQSDFSGRHLRTSFMDDKIYEDPKSNKRPHILSSIHMNSTEDLPF